MVIRSRIENPEINPDTYGQLIFDKGGQNIKWEKKTVFQQVLLGNLDSCTQINETRTQPHTMHKNKLKRAERFNYKTRHHQTPGREHRQNIPDINLRNVFSGQSPKATEIRAKINQWDLIK